MSAGDDRLRAAIVLESPQTLGGGFSQSLNLARELIDWPNDDVEFTLLALGTSPPDGVEALGMPVHQVPDSRFARLIDRAAGMSLLVSDTLARFRALVGTNLGRSLDAKLERLGIDLVLFAGPSWNAMRLCETNFIVTVWDACHRDHPEFPEVRAGREFERREALYARALPRAVAVIVDSDRLGARIGRLYGVDPERIVVLPYKPSPTLRDAAATGNATANPQWGFVEPYVLYPAQFWAHKNHVYVLEGLAALRSESGLVVHAMFCGGDRGNAPTVEARARRLGVRDQVHLLGFVSPEELVHLYGHALALVMPTYFGPTNIPPLEAFSLGCPVIVSDIASFRESYGDAALYCDLGDPRSLAAHIRALHEGADLRRQLAARGGAVLAAIGETDYRARLAGPLQAFRRKHRAFRNA